jgi:hypothetical protein
LKTATTAQERVHAQASVATDEQHRRFSLSDRVLLHFQTRFFFREQAVYGLFSI